MLKSLPAPEQDAAEWDRECDRRVFAWAAEQVRVCVEDSTWQAFWLMAVEGKSGREVADSLGMTIGAVYVAKSRVVARLKKKVDEVQGE